MGLIQGERKGLELWINNTGVEDVSEVWMVSGPENVVWIERPTDGEPEGETLAIERNEANLFFRFKGGGFPVVKQRLEPCAVTDTN